MKKLYFVLLSLYCIVSQTFAQSYFNVYQENVVLKQIQTSKVDSISVTATTPHIVTFWYEGRAIQNYNTAEIDSITISVEEEPLSYIGIVGFNDELYVKDMDILASSTASQYRSFVSNLPQHNGTLLYYAVDNALDMLGRADIRTPLSSVNLVTFTDGLDQGSVMMNSKYNSSKDYLNAMSTLIGNSTYYGLPVNAYSVGLRGNDVSDMTTFRNNLARLASSSEKSFEVNSVSDLRSKFQEIANQIVSVSTRQTISLRIPGIDSGTRVRFVFDGTTAQSSSLYIEGTINLADRTLRNVTYHGMKSRSGSVVQGTQSGIFLTFTFLGLQRTDGGQTLPTNIRHYYLLPSSTTWQLNSEFTPDNNTQRSVSHSGTAIMLVLDGSSSLGSDFSNVKRYANEFIDMIANNAQPFSLEAPTNVEAKLDDATFSIIVSWDAVRHAEYYRVYRSSSANDTFTLVGDKVTSSSWKDEKPLSGRNCYQVEAVGHGLTSKSKVIVGDKSGTINGRTYVDLGLPSGTLWATCNIGADNPEDYGDYFAWGETTAKSDYYSWSTYKWGNWENKLTKYCTDPSYGYDYFCDNKTVLEQEDDAAYINWGSEWRIPSSEQAYELADSWYTNTELTTQNGVSGVRITSKINGKCIFLPFGGYKLDDSTFFGVGEYFTGWLLEVVPGAPYYAKYMLFNGQNYNGPEYYYRDDGRNIRPVRASQ